MGDAVEGEQVVHAQRVKRDRLDDHELVVALLVGKRRQRDRLVRQQLVERGGDPPRRVAQPLVADVATQRQQQVADRALGARPIEAGMLGAALEAPVDVQRCDRRDMRGAHMRPFTPAPAPRAAATHLIVSMPA